MLRSYQGFIENSVKIIVEQRVGAQNSCFYSILVPNIIATTGCCCCCYGVVVVFLVNVIAA